MRRTLVAMLTHEARRRLWPDRTRPRVSVQATTVRRGRRAEILFHMAGNRGFVRVQATFSYHGRVLARGTKSFNPALWSDVYYFWFDCRGPCPPGPTRCVCASPTEEATPPAIARP